MIDLSGFWTRLGLDVVLGAVSGGVTSWVAVVLIFRPYQRTFGLHGAIPKNKARLARTIGRTVGERLLTPDDIVAELHRSGLREAIEQRLAEFVVAALDQERGSLHELLSPAMTAELERALRDLGPVLAESYERLYYTGLLHERRAKAQMRVGRPPHTLAPLFGEAMRCFAEAEMIRPTGNDDAILRWNRCARLLQGHPGFVEEKESEAFDAFDSSPI